MFVVSINSIKNGAQARKFGGSASLIPPHFANLVVGGDRSIDVIVSIESDLPEQRGTAAWEGDDSALITDWLFGQYGMHGKPVGDSPSPIDLIHALTLATWLEWEILKGKEILDIPLEELPSGAIA